MVTLAEKKQYSRYPLIVRFTIFFSNFRKNTAKTVLMPRNCYVFFEKQNVTITNCQLGANYCKDIFIRPFLLNQNPYDLRTKRPKDDDRTKRVTLFAYGAVIKYMIGSLSSHQKYWTHGRNTNEHIFGVR